MTKYLLLVRNLDEQILKQNKIISFYKKNSINFLLLSGAAYAGEPHCVFKNSLSSKELLKPKSFIKIIVILLY